MRTLNFIGVAVFLDEFGDIGMELLAVFEEVFEVIIVIRDFLEGKVLSEGFPQIEYLTILPFILLQKGAIDLVELGNLCYCSHPHIGVAQLITHRVTLHIQ